MNQRHVKRKTNRRSHRTSHEGFIDLMKEKLEKGVDDFKQVVKKGMSSVRGRDRSHA